MTGCFEKFTARQSIGIKPRRVEKLIEIKPLHAHMQIVIALSTQDHSENE